MKKKYVFLKKKSKENETLFPMKMYLILRQKTESKDAFLISWINHLPHIPLIGAIVTKYQRHSDRVPYGQENKSTEYVHYCAFMVMEAKEAKAITYNYYMMYCWSFNCFSTAGTEYCDNMDNHCLKISKREKLQEEGQCF